MIPFGQSAAEPEILSGEGAFPARTCAPEKSFRRAFRLARAGKDGVKAVLAESGDAFHA
jgi:hypothetical protein